MNSRLKKARAFAPGHITGLFEIHDGHADPLHRGSVGAGFSVTAGTVTTVTVVQQATREIIVEYNDEIIHAPVTRTVVERLLSQHNRNMKVRVQHESALPIGVGFGASGAGALSAAISLGHILNSDLTLEEAARYAHYAEVTNHTGLGDVLAQVAGGFEIRLRPGAPGVGEIMNISSAHMLHVVLAGATGLETRSFLTDPSWRARINEVGGALTKRVVSNPTVETFVACSREFANETGLMTERVESALDDLSSRKFGDSSMVMLGDSVFCLCAKSDMALAVKILSDHWNSSEIMSTSIASQGGRLV